MLVKHYESSKCNNDEMTSLFSNSCNTSCHIKGTTVHRQWRQGLGGPWPTHFYGTLQERSRYSNRTVRIWILAVTVFRAV